MDDAGEAADASDEPQLDAPMPTLSHEHRAPLHEPHTATASERMDVAVDSAATQQAPTAAASEGAVLDASHATLLHDTHAASDEPAILVPLKLWTVMLPATLLWSKCRPLPLLIRT